MWDSKAELNLWTVPLVGPEICYSFKYPGPDHSDANFQGVCIKEQGQTVNAEERPEADTVGQSVRLGKDKNVPSSTYTLVLDPRGVAVFRR